MADSLIVSQETVPDRILDRESQLYDGFLAYVLLGTPKTATLEQKGVPRRTYDRWLCDYPEWVESVRQRALADALEHRRQTSERLATARLAAQEKIDELVLPQAGALAEGLLKIATGGSRETARIAATKELGSMVREGWAYPRLEEQPRQAEPEARLVYNPNTDNVQGLGLHLPPGSEVTITARTPDPVLDLPSLPGDRHTDGIEAGYETPQS